MHISVHSNRECNGLCLLKAALAALSLAAMDRSTFLHAAIGQSLQHGATDEAIVIVEKAEAPW